MGVRKVPSSRFALDVGQDLGCAASLRMYAPADDGTGFDARATVWGLRAGGARPRVFADGRGILNAAAVSSAIYFQSAAGRRGREDRIPVHDVRAVDDAANRRREVVVRFGAHNGRVADLDAVDNTRPGDILRMGDTAYRVRAAEYHFPPPIRLQSP
ncbi:MAG: hypothetical protein ABEI52_11800 [Halobacteriaceae archaeon]